MNKHILFPILFLVALACSACEVPFIGEVSNPKVAVVGDSITNHSEDEIKAGLKDYQRYVKGTPSIDIPDGTADLVTPAVDSAPKILVVELGINSAQDGWDSTDLPALEKALKVTDKVDCAIWITPTAAAPSYYDRNGPGTLRDRITQMRKSVEKRLPQHPNLKVLNFGPTEDAHPGWYTDGLHLNATGQQAYADFVVDAIKDGC